jgi:hypothetical protein
MAKQQFDVQTLKKHHFWIVFALLLLVAPVLWILATGSLAEMFNKGKSDREAVRNKISKFVAEEQPNASITKELQDRHDQLKQRVLKLWEERHKTQDPYMYFDLPGIELEFIEGADAKGKPIIRREPMFLPRFLEELRKQSTEEHVKSVETARTSGKDVAPVVRQFYALWLRGSEPETAQFPRLYKMIGLRKQEIVIIKKKEKEKEKGKKGEDNFAGQFGPRDGDLKKIEWIGRVAWSAEERAYLEAKFGQGNAWLSAPTTRQMVYTQESLNVYAVLLKYAIGVTNRDQLEHQLLPIKKIVTLRFGEDCALPAAGGVAAGGGGMSAAPPGAGAVPDGGGAPAPAGGMGFGEGNGGGAGPDEPFAVGPLGGSGGGGGGGGIGAGGGGGLAPPDGTFRYVNDEGFAIADPKEQPYSEFRMLPVTMRVVMDCRYLPILLDNCLNSPLPIEVKQWNMRTVGGAGETSSGFGGGGIDGGNFPRGGGAPGVAGAGGAPGPAPAGAFGGGGAGALVPDGDGGGAFGGQPAFPAGGGGEQPDEAVQFGGEIEIGPYDREVEIKGIIYIYSPPDPEKVGAGTLAKTAETAGEPAPTDGAVSPPGNSDNGAKKPADGGTKSEPGKPVDAPAPKTSPGAESKEPAEPAVKP